LDFSYKIFSRLCSYVFADDCLFSDALGAVRGAGVADANYCFITVDIGSYGTCSDSTAYKNSNFGQMLENGQLSLPDNATLPDDQGGRSMPFVLVGDEAFALSEHLLRPYPRRELTQTKKIFNYKLTRARRMVECAFGILANKWRVLHRPMDMNPEFCDSIIKICCVLHNCVRQRDGITFDDAIYECPLQNLTPGNTRTRTSAISARDYFANYFISPQGSVPWQYDQI
ncbi:protein ANTAGONIST OF LIKE HETEROCHROMATIN PROTEIN 1, partial [Elysia marginata]